MKQNKQSRDENIIYGRHCVMESLKSGVSIDRIFIRKNLNVSFFREIRKKATETGIPVVPVEESALSRLCGGGNHQGIVARLSLRKYDTVEDILSTAGERGEDPFILVLNEVQDVHNLGSLLRTALCAGVHGVIIPKRRSARLSPTTSKVSAGADAHIKVAIVPNIADTLLYLKELGLFIIGADFGEGVSCFEFNFSGPRVLVLGGEDQGLGKRVKNTCDALVKIPLKGPIFSLNVGVAGGILLFLSLRS